MRDVGMKILFCPIETMHIILSLTPLVSPFSRHNATHSQTMSLSDKEGARFLGLSNPFSEADSMNSWRSWQYQNSAYLIYREVVRCPRENGVENVLLLP